MKQVRYRRDLIHQEKALAMDVNQYVKPGEFSFCSCGVFLVPIRGQVCGSCEADKIKIDSRSDMYTFGKCIGTKMAMRGEARAIHHFLDKARNELAETRHRKGYKPLFWLNEVEQMTRTGERIWQALEEPAT